MKSFRSFVLHIELMMQIDEVAFDKESKFDWCCGITGNPSTNSIYQLRKTQMDSNDKLPNLDLKSICKVKASTADIALGVKRLMKSEGFDIDDDMHTITEDSQIWIYAFRKEKQTFFVG